MNENIKIILRKKVTKRWILEMSPFIALLISAICIFILAFTFLEQANEIIQQYPAIVAVIGLGSMWLCYLVAWVVNMKWLFKDRKALKNISTGAYDEKLVNLFNIASILYVTIFFFIVAILLRGSLRHILQDKIKPNTLAAFINEKYLKRVG